MTTCDCTGDCGSCACDEPLGDCPCRGRQLELWPGEADLWPGEGPDSSAQLELGLEDPPHPDSWPTRDSSP